MLNENSTCINNVYNHKYGADQDQIKEKMVTHKFLDIDKVAFLPQIFNFRGLFNLRPRFIL